MLSSVACSSSICTFVAVTFLVTFTSGYFTLNNRHIIIVLGEILINSVIEWKQGMDSNNYGINNVMIIR